MEFREFELYHIYNRGNNQQTIFFSPRNYEFFISKIRKHIKPVCEILAWCLMPNHFHFLIYTDNRVLVTKIINGEERNVLSEGIRNTLSSYTQAINKQNASTGSLFQQNTRAKLIAGKTKTYDHTCFHYIHQNPYKAKMVNKMEDWNYSSFTDYCGERNNDLTNSPLAIQLLGLNRKTFYADSYRMIDDENSKGLF